VQQKRKNTKGVNAFARHCTYQVDKHTAPKLREKILDDDSKERDKLLSLHTIHYSDVLCCLAECYSYPHSWVNVSLVLPEP
jgi:hypothetical protein